MPKVTEFAIQKLPDLYVMGRTTRIKYDELHNNVIPMFWQNCIEEDIFRLSSQIKKIENENMYDFSYVGYMCNFDYVGFDYTAGILLRQDITAQIPEIKIERYIKRNIKAVDVALTHIKGSETQILGDAQYMAEEEIKKTNYKIMEQNYWCMELYNLTRFTTPDENGEIVLDYYIPVVRK